MSLQGKRAAQDAPAVLGQLHDMQMHGFHAPQIARQLSERLRTALIGGEAVLSGEQMRHAGVVSATQAPGRARA